MIREVGGQSFFVDQAGNIVQLTEPEIPAHELPASLTLDVSKCRFGDHKIRWGKTTKGKKAPFDYDPPHRNHWIGCKPAQAARKAAKG